MSSLPPNRRQRLPCRRTPLLSTIVWAGTGSHLLPVPVRVTEMRCRIACMAAQVRVGRAYFFVSTGRAAQVVWLLFALLALSLALPGIALYRQLLQNVCAGAGCVTGQLTPAEGKAAITFSGSLPAY